MATKINVHFAAPEPYYGLELDAQSEAAYTRWMDAEGDGGDEWDEFVTELERQLRPMMGTRGCIEEAYVD
jgi:hypothetical protein